MTERGFVIIAIQPYGLAKVSSCSLAKLTQAIALKMSVA